MGVALALSMPTAAQAADTAPPQVQSMILQPAAGVDVSTQARQVRAVLRITDNDTGVRLITAQLKSVDTTQITPIRLGLRVAGTPADGTWWINFTLPQGAAPGDWKLDVIAVDDEAGNRLNGATIPDASLPRIPVTSVADPDTDAPVLDTMTLSPSTVDVGPSAQTVTASFHVTDQTGAAHVLAGLKHLDTGQILPNKQAALVSGTAQDGTWEATYTIPKGGPAGLWQLRVVTFDDVLTNSATGLFFPPAQLPTVDVTVSTAPDTPTAVQATPGNGQATVSWAAPDDGGSPITSYVVTSDPGSISKSVAGDQTSVDVDGLENGTAYTFTVVAQNAVGDSAASDPSSAVTPKAPFSVGPTATITGNAEVGQTLTAHEGTPDPAPDSFHYEWFADDAPINGANGPTLGLTNAHAGERITVRITAIRTGFHDASDTSDPTDPVVGQLEVTAADSIVRSGRYVRVNATGLFPREAFTVAVDGQTVKSGLATTRGTVGASVKVPTTLPEGPAEVTLTAASGSTGSTSIHVITAKMLGVSASPTSVARNGNSTATVTGLAPGETVKVTFNGSRVSPLGATAASDGTYEVPFSVKTRLGDRPLKATGAFFGRVGTATVTVTP